jgi:type VI secretion system secreted protein VgrG
MEEISPDNYGRVTVKFFWDRLGTADEKSSCAIRVATAMAGKNWGMIHLPRIGQEVVVSFLEGDPDRPLIIGLVYNADYMPPYTLPTNKTQSGYRSRSTADGTTDTFNELRFEDLKGSEQVYFHAEKDFNRVVENNDALTVGSSDSNTCADGSQTISIWNNRTTSIETGNETLTVKQGNRTTSINTGNDSLTVKSGTRTVTVSGDTSLEVQQGNRTVTIDTGNDTHKISQGNRQVTISTGNDTLEISTGNLSTKVDLGSASIQAMQSITLTVGQSSVTIDQTGVTIQGMMIKINGQTQTQIQGLQTQVSGTGMVQISGGITMIG